MRSKIYIIAFLFLVSCNQITENNNSAADDIVADTSQLVKDENFEDGVGSEFVEEDTIPVLDQLANGYPDLYKLASTLAEAMISHNESDVIKLCDPDHYETQKEIGISDFQYVYEILNITGMEFKDDDNYKKYCKKVFNEIEMVGFNSFDPLSGAENDEYYLFGYIITRSGDTLNFNITIVLSDGSYYITGPVG